jgi:tellurite methyltransferase
LALDVACGAGRNALYLAERGWRVVAIDGSEVAVNLLSVRAASQQFDVTARVVDLEREHLDLPADAYDLVLCCYYLQRDLIPRLKVALRPGGILIMIVHLGDDGHPPDAARAHAGELRALWDHWCTLHDREGEPEESGHRHGVAELVARKPTSTN